jgi:hypothetical protein
MSLTDRATRYESTAADLAAWLRARGTESWWTVDGDPDLTGAVDFPCTHEELAAELELRGIQPLVLHGPETGLDAPIGTEEIDRVVSTDRGGNRVLQLSWADSGNVWLLIEDKETMIEVQDTLRVSDSVEVEVIRGEESQADVGDEARA